MRRTADVKRKTKETEIVVSLDLDGTGSYRIDTPIGFFNHLLENFARHGGFDLTLKVEGDIHVDQHHVIEDCGIVLGQAIEKALGDKRGILRAGFFIFPMDEVLALAAIDFGGRPYLQYDIQFSHQYRGSMEIGLLEDFFQAMSVHARANIVVRILHGRSDHHKAEATFKALAKAMRMACEKDVRNACSIPSTKGVI